MKTNKVILNKYTSVLLCSVLALFGCSKDDTTKNRSPEKTVLLSPANQLQSVEIENLNLEWQSATDLDGDAVAYGHSLLNEITIEIAGGATIPIVFLTQTELKLRINNSQQLNFVRDN